MERRPEPETLFAGRDSNSGAPGRRRPGAQALIIPLGCLVFLLLLGLGLWRASFAGSEPRNATALLIDEERQFDLRPGDARHTVEHTESESNFATGSGNSSLPPRQTKSSSTTETWVAPGPGHVLNRSETEPDGDIAVTGTDEISYYVARINLVMQDSVASFTRAGTPQVELPIGSRGEQDARIVGTMQIDGHDTVGVMTTTAIKPPGTNTNTLPLFATSIETTTWIDTRSHSPVRIETTGLAADGHTVFHSTTDFSVWERVPLRRLPPDLFTFKVPEGARVTGFGSGLITIGTPVAVR